MPEFIKISQSRVLNLDHVVEVKVFWDPNHQRGQGTYGYTEKVVGYDLRAYFVLANGSPIDIYDEEFIKLVAEKFGIEIPQKPAIQSEN